MLNQLKKKFNQLFRLNEIPVIRLYRGYSNGFEHIIFGHLLELSPSKPNYTTKNIFTTTLALIRLFMVRPVPKAIVQMEYAGTHYEASTEDDGFFKFEWKSAIRLEPGIYDVDVSVKSINNQPVTAEVHTRGELMSMHENQYACLSDIDDTFLISHSGELMRRLRVLLTQNAHSRKPFDGVVKHYQLLADAGTKDGLHNPFFYVSSSEWNLYEYIRQFNEKNDLPEGVLLLSQLKTISEAWKTGQNKHATKFMRIARVFELFVHHQFILMGDDSQQDPVIYQSVVKHFPSQVKAVYLRHVNKGDINEVEKAIANIEAAGVPCCHFSHSKDAIEHSISIGLITKESFENFVSGKNHMA
jgi:phosphatidate phosphatase APP1